MRKVTITIVSLLFGLALAACDDAGDDAGAPPATTPQQDAPPAQQ
jgi:hypothetical protein